MVNKLENGTIACGSPGSEVRKECEKVDALIPKYKIGDIVYGATEYIKCKQIQCPDCLGKKVWEVKLPNGENFTVPCYTCERGFEGSSGYISEWVHSPEVTKLTIGSVRINSEDECPVSYMCAETGIGSGIIHHEENLFTDRLDALKYSTEKAKEIMREQNNEHRRVLELGKKRSKRNPLRT